MARKHPDGSPSPSALRQWADKGIIRPQPDYEPWHLGMFDPRDDALVLPVLRGSLRALVTFADQSEDDWDDRDVLIPVRVAEWVVRIRTAAPELDPADDWLMHWVRYLAILASRGLVREVEAALALGFLGDKNGSQALGRLYELGYLTKDFRPRSIVLGGTMETASRRQEERTMAGSGGQVRQRPDRDLWEGRYWLDGRRRSVYGATKREAQEKLRAALNAASAGIRPTSQRLTVGAYLGGWLETSVKPKCRPRTYRSYHDTVKGYIVPAVGRQPLAKLEPAHVAAMLADLTTRGRLSPTTVRYCYVVLRIALGRAYKQGLVLRNVTTLVDPPAKARPERRPLTAGQARGFLASIAGDPREPLYVTALSTGMRQGELLALRWQDVDLDAGTVVVRHTLQQGTHTLAPTKTERSRRTLRLPTRAITILRRHKVAQAEQRLRAGRAWQEGDFVFSTSRGTPLDGRSVTRDFQSALERTGLPHQRFHDLRHGYATLMLEAGEELAVVSRSLGHANLATTADVYSHVTPAMRERSAARMERILAG